MRKSIPSTPPRSELINTLKKSTVSSGYFACRIYNAGSVNMAPATIAPEQAPIDCMITFSPKEFFLFNAPDNPTAMIAIGIAASNT